MRKIRPATVRGGVAGWDYPDWAGVVYPKPKPRGFDPVRYLAGYLDLIEINTTFYRPARREVAERWAERVEGFERFRYGAKLWRRFTHERERVDRMRELVEEPATAVVDVVFNNHARGQAVGNALQFEQALGGGGEVPVPPPLAEAYAAELRRVGRPTPPPGEAPRRAA